MRIALISDVHSNLAALEAVLEEAGQVDKLVCGGDLVGYSSEPNEVVEVLRRKKVQAVRGDHEQAITTKNFDLLDRVAAEAAAWTFQNLKKENLEYLGSLPEELELKLGGKKFFVVHGHPGDRFKGRITSETPNSELARVVGGVVADVVVLSHTHLPMKRTILGKLVVNPGSVGQPRDRDPRASFALLDVGDSVEVEIKRVEYDVERTVKAMKAARLPEELAARLLFGW